MSRMVLLLLYKYSVTLKTSSSCLHFLQSFHVRFMATCVVIFQLWPNDAFVQPQYIAFLTLFTIFLRIVSTVKLVSFSASTCAHCLEGFALLCIITTKSISSSITYYTRKDTQRGIS